MSAKDMRVHNELDLLNKEEKVIKRFLNERGVRPDPPKIDLRTYPEYWSRTTRWLAAEKEAEALVSALGHEQAIDLLNLAVGAPAFFAENRFVPQLNTQGKYGFILLPGGCKWALEDNGRCTFCEFQEFVDELVGDLVISHDEFMAIFNAGFATMHDSKMLNVFTAGSFLNPGEIPMATQALMAQAVADSEITEILRVESRVQYIVEDTVAPLVNILGSQDKTLDIAIGFETQDDILRNKSLRKGMSRKGFIRAVETSKRLGARVSAYVMLMPVEMEEGHALKECIDSIRFAFECGVDEVLLQARYSHYPETRCPKLWSIIKVLRETSSLGPVMLGRWEGELPEPVVWPKNCDVCTPLIMPVLEQWRSDLDPAHLSDDNLPDCSCKKAWEEKTSHAEPSPKRQHLPIVQDE